MHFTVSAQEQEQEETIETKILNEGMDPLSSANIWMILIFYCLVEYKNWKKNAPFLYDLLLRYIWVVKLACATLTFWQHCSRLANAYSRVASGQAIVRPLLPQAPLTVVDNEH